MKFIQRIILRRLVSFLLSFLPSLYLFHMTINAFGGPSVPNDMIALNSSVCASAPMHAWMRILCKYAVKMKIIGSECLLGSAVSVYLLFSVVYKHLEYSSLQVPSAKHLFGLKQAKIFFL